MTAELLIEQLLNGLQFGFMLFLMSAGLTLIFGVMGLINLAHGSFYMIGAFSAAATFAFFNSFWLSLFASFSCAAVVGVIVEKAKGEKCPRCWKILLNPCERNNCGLKN